MSLRRDLGLNRQTGRGSFIDSVLTNVKTYYGEVLQQLVAWKPRAPKLPQLKPGPIESETVPTPEPIEIALDAAEDEASPDESFRGE